LTIIKPDAVKKNAIGDIIEHFEKNGFRILAIKMLEISQHQAEQFYRPCERPFYQLANQLHVQWTDRALAWKRKTPSPICAS